MYGMAKIMASKSSIINGNNNESSISIMAKWRREMKK
jgi:hypothetical protein